MLQFNDIGLIYAIICGINVLLVILCIRQIRVNVIQRNWTSALVFFLNLVGLLLVLYVFGESAHLIWF